MPDNAPADDFVAVVGMACRVPKADGLDAFWHLLADGVDATTDVPPGRWEQLEPGDPVLPAAALRGGFLDHVDRFDPGFFGIAPAEAAVMDPRQRLMLELSWEAPEDAGIVPAALADDRVGVFTGTMGNDYAVLTPVDRPGERRLPRMSDSADGLRRGEPADRPGPLSVQRPRIRRGGQGFGGDVEPLQHHVGPVRGSGGDRRAGGYEDQQRRTEHGEQAASLHVVSTVSLGNP